MGTHSNSEKWENFLNPEVFKERLINISMYITTFEMLKDSIINRIKDFYIIPLVNNDAQALLDYKQQVLMRNKKHLYASMDWMIDHEIIDDDDKKEIENLKSYRNYLAHDMSDIVFNGEIEKLIENFIKAYQLIHKIEKWWIINFELEVSLMYDNLNYTEIDYDGIRSGKTIMLDMALQLISGNDELLKIFKDEKSSYTNK